MNTDEHRCTQMDTDRKKNIQTNTNIGRERNGERERGGGSRKKGQTDGGETGGGEYGKEGRKRHRETQERRHRYR